jgi:hypothetical protein
VGRSKSTATIVNTGEKPTDGKCSADFVAFQWNQVPSPVLSLLAAPTASYAGLGCQGGVRYCVPLYLPTARHAPVALVGTLEALPGSPHSFGGASFCVLTGQYRNTIVGVKWGIHNIQFQSAQGALEWGERSGVALPHTYSCELVTA